MGFPSQLLAILQGPAVLIFLWVCALALVFTMALRKVDPNAPIMCGVLVGLWFVEIAAKAYFGETFRAMLPVTDMVAAGIAVALGFRRPSDWLMGVYVTLAISCGLHVFWQWRGGANVLTKWEYILLLNALFVMRLACILTPGVAYVGKVVGAHLLGDRHRPSLVLARGEDRGWKR